MGKAQRFIAVLIAFVLIACNKPTDTAATDPSNPNYWTPERIAAYRAKQDAIQHGKVSVGMYAADCFSAWGKPDKINRTTTANGVHEQWIYNGHGYLYIDNGILTAIQE